MNTGALITRFFIVYLKSKMEYRFSFFMDIAINVFTYLINYIGIWVILQKFDQINGWGFYEVLFLYNLNLFSYGLSCFVFWTPMRSLENIVRDGSFDLILTRPMNPFLNLILKQSYHGFLGHILLGIVIFVVCYPHLNIEWSLLNIFYLLCIVFGATCIHSAILIVTGVISFWTVKSTSIMNAVIYGIRGFTDYPMSIYNKSIQFVLTFIIPYAFVNYYPAEYLLNKGAAEFSNNYLYFGAPIVGGLMLVSAYLFWLLGLKNYKGTGS